MAFNKSEKICIKKKMISLYGYPYYTIKLYNFVDAKAYMEHIVIMFF